MQGPEGKHGELMIVADQVVTKESDDLVEQLRSINGFVHLRRWAGRRGGRAGLFNLLGLSRSRVCCGFPLQSGKHFR